MKQKKILIATPLYPPQVGGPASRTVLLEKKFPERGFHISVAKFSNILWLPKIIRHIAYFFMVFFKGIFANTILAQDPVSTGLPTLFASKILFKKFVLIIVGDYAWEQGSQRAGVTDLLDAFSTETDKYPLLVRVFKKVQFFVANHADKIIVPSFYLKKIITNWGIPADKIFVVYNSFDPPVLNEDRESLRKKLNLSGHVVVSAGRLVPWKGFNTLISAVLPKVLKEFPDTKLLIIGDGPDKAYLETVIAESNMKEHAILVGRKPQNELFSYIKAADVFALNTSYEGMSHQLLEVMALGTPIVTTDAGGNVEVVTSGEGGVLTHFNESDKMAEEIIRFLKDKEWKEKIVSKGSTKIKSFSEEKMLSELSKELS
jgi:glycosyltransferase involved in cell wall biosynthesis